MTKEQPPPSPSPVCSFFFNPQTRLCEWVMGKGPDGKPFDDWTIHFALLDALEQLSFMIRSQRMAMMMQMATRAQQQGIVLPDGTPSSMIH